MTPVHRPRMVPGRRKMRNHATLTAVFLVTLLTFSTILAEPVFSLNGAVRKWRLGGKKRCGGCGYLPLLCPPGCCFPKWRRCNWRVPCCNQWRCRMRRNKFGWRRPICIPPLRNPSPTPSASASRTPAPSLSSSPTPSTTPSTTPTPSPSETPAEIAGSPQVPQNCVRCIQEQTICPSGCCTPKWYQCTVGGSSCCDGWACTAWKYGTRCQPACVPNWHRCDQGNSNCCNGWRCVNWTYGKRCEP